MERGGYLSDAMRLFLCIPYFSPSPLPNGKGEGAGG